MIFKDTEMNEKAIFVRFDHQIGMFDDHASAAPWRPGDQCVDPGTCRWAVEQMQVWMRRMAPSRGET